MADPHNDYLERAENYERLAEEAQDPVLAAAFRRLARNCRLTAERVSELEESLRKPCQRLLMATAVPAASVPKSLAVSTAALATVNGASWSTSCWGRKSRSKTANAKRSRWQSQSGRIPA